MIIACPACATRYVVPDNAIGIDGRTVRCAKCRHSWFQDGGAVETAAEPLAAAPSPPPSPAPASAAPSPDGEPAGDAPPLATEVRPPPVYAEGGDGLDEARSSFDHEPPFRPRINRAKMWTLAASVFAAVSIAAIAAVAWYGLPDWAPMSRASFAQAQPGLVLDFPPNRQDRRTLPNGTEFFGASGTVTNVAGTRRSVPAILILLRDSRERVVYSWVVHPPKTELSPGESMTINEAVTDVPRSAKFADIGWKPG
ncbi:MAG TPA: zinc-ribbon domain-containing protein [Novosphingobium sp.]